MKNYSFVLVFLICIISSCSKDNNVEKSELEAVKIETRRGDKDCVASDIPCDLLSTDPIFSLLVGVTSDPNDFRYGVGDNGVLDDLINCMNPHATDTYCNRECTETIDIEFASIESTACEYGWSEYFTANEQLALIEQLQDIALFSAPDCNGVPMVPINYDVYANATVSTIWFHLIVEYGSPCIGGDGIIVPDGI